MAQPSITCFFKSRKRAAIDDTKIKQARKVLVLDSSDATAIRSKQNKPVSSNTDIKELLIKNKNPESGSITRWDQISNNEQIEDETQKTPPSTPTKRPNAMDKISAAGPSIKEIRSKLSRSSRLSELKASLARIQESDKLLSEIEHKTSKIDSPKLKTFRTIELEIATSPQKVYSPEKAYLSPRKENSGVRKNLLNLLSPTKNALPTLCASPSKELLTDTSRPALTLPFKYRFLAEMFRAVDTIMQIMYNRRETITFRKLKPAVEEMLKRNLMEQHLAQMKTVFPQAFNFKQEKLKIYGGGVRAERWELVITPIVENGDKITSEILLERRRLVFNTLLNRVKDYHHEFLSNLDTPIIIPRDKITRWHPEFNIEKVPDIEEYQIPQPPEEDVIKTGKDVLERARVLFQCNTRMEQALQKLHQAKETQTPLPVQETAPEMPTSILKGIPKALLERVRQKQAAKALVSITRSVNKEKEVQLYSRLPELARLTRNLFVSEKKSVLPLDTVVDKLGISYRGNLNKSEMEDHLKVLANDVPSWLVFHNIRNCVYLKLNKNADLSLVIAKLEDLSRRKCNT